MGNEVRYRRLRLSVAATSNSHDYQQHWVYGRKTRNLVIAGSLIFSLAIAIYVSIPDFPYKEKAWQVELWSDPSGWWSEITWIIGFGVFATLSLLFRSWFYSLRPKSELIRKAQLGVLFTVVSWIAFSLGFVMYFKPVWSDLYANIALDDTGALHGLFYLTVAHLGILATISGLALAACVVATVADKQKTAAP